MKVALEGRLYGTDIKINEKTKQVQEKDDGAVRA